MPDPGPRVHESRPPAVDALSKISGRQRAAREIVESLQADMASGQLPLGSRLPSERDLAKHFGVSQPTVREAVRALDMMGLVDVRHGSGVYVTGDVSECLATSLRTLLTLEHVGIVDVVNLRLILGGYSARLAAERVTVAEIERMTEYLELCDASHSDVAPRALVAAVASFQLSVSASARNPLLFAIESFLIKLACQWQLSALGEDDRQFWVDRVSSFAADRSRLLAFIAARDSDGAVNAMQMYLRSQFSRFSSDPELEAFTTTELGSLASGLDDLLPDLRPTSMS